MLKFSNFIKLGFLGILYLFTTAHLLGQPIHWDGKSPSVNIGKKVWVLQDARSQLSIEQVADPANAHLFTQSNQAVLNLGFTESVYWIKLVIDNQAPVPPLLEVAQARIPSVRFYFKDAKGHWQSYGAGYRVPPTQKVIKHHFQLFPLTPTGTEYYLRVQNVGASVPLLLWDKNVYEQENLIALIIYGIYIGIMAFVILYNLFFFLSLRKPIYLHYTWLVFLYAFFATLEDGYILYLFPRLDLLFWYSLNPIINQPNGLLYCIFFLEVWKYAPVLYKISLGITAYFASYILWNFFLPTMTVLALSEVHALIGISLMALLGIVVGIKGNKLGYYFATAYCLFFVVAAIEVTYARTGSPAYIVEISHVSVGILIEVFILAYALSKRFEWEQAAIIEARSDAQQQLLEKTRENEQLLRDQNEMLEIEVNARTKVIAQKTQELQQSLDHLKTTQNQLIQKEKTASLGELTAGIAHEIQNPLNFVNNFAEISDELAEELQESVQAGNTKEAITLAGNIRSNMQHVAKNGQRASSIVRAMLEHSRTSVGQEQLTNLNLLADEFLKLAYHGMRAKDSKFTVKLITEFAADLPELKLVTQDIGRVLLNLYNNAFYAVNEKAKQQIQGYEPTVRVRTQHLDGTVKVVVHDNGTGIPEPIRAKIFQPFFTTKPTGQGTGLGLSLSYDTVINGHNGQIQVHSQDGEFTEFEILFPLNA